MLAGEDDPATPVSEAEKLVRALTRAPVEFIRYPECGHGVFREVPDDALSDIRRFLLRLDV